jgi:hypothetical protein
METRRQTPASSRPWTGLILIGFLGVAAFFLVTEHTAHLFGALPYLLLLLCPLMHLFMHHGHHGSHDDHNRPTGHAQTDDGQSMGEE